MAKIWYDHIHLISPEPSKTAEFYEKALGAKITGSHKTDEGRVMVDLTLNETSIKVAGPRTKPVIKDASPAGFDHFGLKTDNIEEAVEEFKKYGGKVLQEIRLRPGRGKVALLLGPDDVLIEIVEQSK